jgi:catechol 2,3-dioxygenase-like lactoylglutathione lyase family enzyme
MPRIIFSPLWVDDLDKAEAFYTSTLGFVIARDIPLAPPAHLPRFVALASSAAEIESGPFLVLSTPPNEAAESCRASLKEMGIPAASFAVGDLRFEYERLDKLGVVFETPADVGDGMRAVLDDTVGNLIELFEVVKEEREPTEVEKEGVWEVEEQS